MTWTFITIPASHYCDKARWALDRAGIAYVEHGHVPLLHWREALKQRGTRTVPILVHDGGVATDSTDILHLIDAQLPAERRLFPVDPELRAQVEAWEDRFDKSLGPATRRVVYHHLLIDKPLMVDVLGANTPPHEVTILKLCFPLIAQLMRRGMNITPQKAAQSREKLHAIFADVGAALADGRRYLVGDRLTAADVAFAALASPMLLPDGHPKLHVAPERGSAAMQADIAALRATPAGQFALRLYREERGY